MTTNWRALCAELMQELESALDDIGLVNEPCISLIDRARAALSEPPSLKQQALDALEEEDDALPLRSLQRGERFALIRRALEQLND